MEVVNLYRQEGRAQLLFARSDRSVNVLDERCMVQLEGHLDALEREPPELLVLQSGMPGCFIAGADLQLIAAVDDKAAATRLAERGQAVCRRIEALPSLSIAVVHGACMGGGLEIALACDHIAAVTDAKTQLALPEIKIGIHPGFGGCVRLPARIGWVMAVEMILSGRAVDAARAKRIGLASITCHAEQVEAAIEALAARGKPGKRPFSPGWLRLPPLRWYFFRQVEKKAYARLQHLDVEQAYPAVPATIALLKGVIREGGGTAYAMEAESLGRLAVTPTCKNLIRVFYLGEALKKQAAVKQGRDSATAVSRAAVYGAGVMGSGIAWVAAKSCQVDLHDVSPEALSHGMRTLAGLAKRDVRRLQRIRPALDASGLGDRQLVIEAVLEELELKQALWREVEAEVPADALLLTNTSSLSVSEMQAGREHAERMAGLHFFNPAPKMPLVEVIGGQATSQATLETVCALAAGWGKYPLIVADAPGFLVNRCLMPFMAAALRLVEAGQKPAHVDGALKCFGMPMGAVELADRVGLDICAHVGAHLGEQLGARFAMPAWFSGMVDDGLLGAKSGQGFYRYEQGQPAGINPRLADYLPAAKLHEHEGDAEIGGGLQAMRDADIVDACLLPMLVEALACLQQQVVADPLHLDAGFIFGIGFPPFRGGLLRYFAGFDRAELERRIGGLGLALPDNLEVLDGFR